MFGVIGTILRSRGSIPFTNLTITKASNGTKTAWSRTTPKTTLTEESRIGPSSVNFTTILTF